MIAAIDRRSDSPIIAAGTAIVAWAFGPVIVRGFDVSTPTILLFRMLVSIPLMIGVAYLTGGRLSRRSLHAALIPGILFAGNVMTSFESYRRTSIANATLIQSLSPALVLLTAGWIFHEQRSRRQVQFALLAFVGVAVVIIGSGSTEGASLSGDAIAGVNLVLWTIYFMRMKHVRSVFEVDAWSLVASIFLVGGCVLIPWALIVSGDLGGMTHKDWVLTLVLCFGPGLIGHGLMTWAQRFIDVTLASLLSLASAPISTVAAWAIYGQSLHPLQVFGSAMVITSLALIVVERNSSRQSTTASTPEESDALQRRA